MLPFYDKIPKEILDFALDTSGLIFWFFFVAWIWGFLEVKFVRRKKRKSDPQES